MSYSRGYGGDSFCFGLKKNITPPLRSIQNAKNPEILQQMDPLVGVDSVRSILERNKKNQFGASLQNIFLMREKLLSTDEAISTCPLLVRV